MNIQHAAVVYACTVTIEHACTVVIVSVFSAAGVYARTGAMVHAPYVSSCYIATRMWEGLGPEASQESKGGGTGHARLQ